MDIEARQAIETASVEIDACLNILIEATLADAEICNEDMACALMRVRKLIKTIRETREISGFQ